MFIRSACVAAVSLTRNAMHRRQNAAAVYRADSITSTTWTPLGNPTHNATSFSSQSTYILPVNGSFIYIAMGRLWPWQTCAEPARVAAGKRIKRAAS